MQGNDNIPHQDRAGLRNFGLLMAAFIAGLFGLLFPWVLGKTFPVWPWLAGTAFVSWSLIHPSSLNFLYHGWMRFGLVMGWFSSRLVLGVIFYCIFMPVSFVFRLRGIDPLQRRLDASVTSYRKQSTIRDIKHMEKPF